MTMAQTQETPPARPGAGGVVGNGLEKTIHHTASPGEGEAGESAGLESDKERPDSPPAWPSASPSSNRLRCCPSVTRWTTAATW
jgi:hypothetical protein